VAIPGTPTFDTSIPMFTYDPAMAKKLLADAGYPNGFKVTNALDYTGAGVTDSLFLAIQDYWRQVGVDVSLQRDELGIWVDKFYSRNNQIRPELISSAGSDPVGTLLFLRQFLTCNNPPERVVWCVPEFDKNMDQAYAEPDATKREALLKQSMRVHQAEVTHVYIMATPSIAIAAPKLRDFSIDSAGVFWTPDKLYRVD
jgi:ABC-type transport system substrate-binding protein